MSASVFVHVCLRVSAHMCVSGKSLVPFGRCLSDLVTLAESGHFIKLDQTMSYSIDAPLYFPFP